MTTMSFLEHLEELRHRLIVCVVAVIICMAVSWPLVPTVQQFITRPLQEPSVTQKMVLCPGDLGHAEIP